MSERPPEGPGDRPPEEPAEAPPPEGAESGGWLSRQLDPPERVAANAASGQRPGDSLRSGLALMGGLALGCIGTLVVAVVVILSLVQAMESTALMLVILAVVALAGCVYAWLVARTAFLQGLIIGAVLALLSVGGCFALLSGADFR